MSKTKGKKGQIMSKKKAVKVDEPKKSSTRPPKKYKKRLKSLSDVRRYLAELIHATRSGEVEQSLAGKLGFLLNLLRGVIADSDLEERLAKLEEEVKKTNE